MKRRDARTALAIALSALALAAPAQAATTAQLQQAIQDCRDAVSAHNAAVNATAAERAQQQMDDFMKQVAHAPVPTSKTTSGGISQNFSCHDITSDAFNDILSSVGNLFGGFGGQLFSTVFSSTASSTASSLCAEAQQATGNLFQNMTINCPSIAVPGMPVACSGNLGVGLGGVTYSGTGSVGGLTGTGSGTVGGTTTGNTNLLTGGTGTTNTTGSGTGWVSQFSCWLGGTCP